MKAIKKFMIGTVAMGAMLWSCTPDKVAPKDEKGPTMGQYSESGHEKMGSSCSDTATLRLISQDGSYNVNWCGFTACPPNQPEWGAVSVINNADTLGLFMQMASGWFIDFNKTWIGVSGNLNFDPSNGRPSTTSGDWLSIDVNPLVNRWMLFMDKNNINKDNSNCFELALNLTVVKLSFFGGIASGSSRTLWAVNPSWDNAQSKYKSNSQYVLSWCWESCAPVWPEATSECAEAFAGMPGNNGCTTLTPDVSGANGTVTYAWSDGNTDASRSVCPTTQTSYTVSISDQDGPYAVIDYNVNVEDVFCSAGNSPLHKVKVCHLPPGNPSNVQNICIDWSAVPAHVERFRALDNNGQPIRPNQGHDSGCEIGECGVNPCD